MASRLKLHEELTKIPNIKRVYFQPPDKCKMEYPCIVYGLNRMSPKFADNKTYLNHKSYTITVITSNPDDKTADLLIAKFSKIAFERQFKSDNLYHNVLNLYY